MIFNNNIDQVIVRISSLPSEDYKVPQIVQTLPGQNFLEKPTPTQNFTFYISNDSILLQKVKIKH